MRSNKEKTIFYHNLSLNINRESSRKVLEILNKKPERTRTNYIETAILEHEQMENTKEALLEFMREHFSSNVAIQAEEKDSPPPQQQNTEIQQASAPPIEKQKKREINPDILNSFTDSLI